MSTGSTSSRPGCVFIIDKEDTMPHDIQQMVYVGKEPWHGLGTPLPANGSYEEIVHAAGFYTAVERPLHSPPMEGPIPDKKTLFREDTGDYLSTVSTGYVPKNRD